MRLRTEDSTAEETETGRKRRDYPGNPTVTRVDLLRPVGDVSEVK